MQSLKGYNFAFFYEYGEEIWSTPMSLINEIISRGGEADRYFLSDIGINDYLCSDKKYDFIFSLDWKGIHLDRLSKNFMKSFMIAELADCPQNAVKHHPKLGHFHLYLCPDFRTTEDLKKMGYNVIWFNHFADSNIHDIYNVKDNYPPVRSTRGLRGSNLMDILSNVMPNKFINRNGLDGENYGKFLNGGLITLQNSRWGEITRRIFEGMACGTMVLTDRLHESTMINTLFTEDVDIVYYDDLADCISKINYYLSDEGWKYGEQIAINGFRNVMNNHTQKNRIDLIMKHV